jgi:hypothetical protein
MALDTVIDKAQLEGAITASADAIREKTGDTALIEWLSDKGFAENPGTKTTSVISGLLPFVVKSNSLIIILFIYKYFSLKN